LIMIESLIGRKRFRSRIFRGSLQVAFRFGSSPLSTSRSCSPCHHVSVLVHCPNSHHNSGAVVTKSSGPVILFNSGEARKVSLRWQGAVVDTNCFSAWAAQRKHRLRLPRLHGRADHLVRRTKPSQILRVKRAERSRDSRADSDEPFFHTWSKQRNPEIVSKEHLRMP